MNRFIALMTAILIIGGTAFSQPGSQQGIQTYEIKEGTFKTITKVVQTGIEMETKTTVHFKEYGKLVARYIEEISNIKMLNRTETSRTHTIMDEDYIISIDLDKMTGTKSRNVVQDFLGDMNQREAEKFGKEMMDRMDAKTEKMGTREIAGYTCTEYLTKVDLGGFKMEVLECKYKGINLLEESENMGVMMSTIVTFLKEGDSGPASAWKPEEGVELQLIDW